MDKIDLNKRNKIKLFLIGILGIGIFSFFKIDLDNLFKNNDVKIIRDKDNKIIKVITDNKVQNLIYDKDNNFIGIK
jgi:hypothetical protein